MSTNEIEMRAWCDRGIRYEDHCVSCGRTADVDNDTDLCRRCYGPPRPVHDVPVISLEERLRKAGLT